MKPSAASTGILIVAFVLCAAIPARTSAQAPAAGEDAVVARIGETTYSLADIRQRLARLEAPYRYAAERRLPEYMKDFLQREVLAREARRRALDREPAVRAEVEDAIQTILIRVLFKQVAAQAMPSPEEVQAYYRAHEAEFSVPEQVEVDQAMVPTEAEAVAIRSAAQAGQSFEAAVEAQARGTVAIATFARGMREPEVEQAIFALAVGDVSLPLRTREGVALFRVRARHPARVQPLDAATAGIQARLGARKQAELWKSLQDQLWAADGVVIHEDRLKSAVPGTGSAAPGSRTQEAEPPGGLDRPVRGKP
jgi:peptidyl-prolyl cis-trans isomerase C